METSGLSASDVALMNRDGYWGGGDGMMGFMWIFALLILANGGFGCFGGFGNGLAGNLATQNDVQRGFDTQNLQSQTRDILSAVTSGTAQSIAAVNDTFHDTVNALSDKYSELQRDIAGLAVGQANLLARENECCCSTLRAIDGVNYNNAMNTASINTNTTAQAQKILDAITSNRIDELQSKVSALELQNAVAGVVRYPNTLAYSAGPSPFCACGYGNI